VDDLLEDLDGLRTPVWPTPLPVAATPIPPALDPSQQRVWDLLTERRHADEITRTLGLPAGELSKLLLTMEMKKLIRRAPGNMYERR
jgi:DNA processing protein